MAVLLTLAGEKAAFAQAQQFGDRGQLVLTAENLFGFSTERFGTDLANNAESSQTYNQFGLLYRSPAAPMVRGWVGGHYFVIPNLSVGATLGFQTAGGSSTSTQNGVSQTSDMDSRFAFILLPKVGYALMLNNMLGFWFRGGPGFMRMSTTDAQNSDNGTAQSYWFLSVDALFVITPAQYVGFYVGPQGNLSFAGSSSRTNNGATTSFDASYRGFSIDAGLFGYFDL